MTTQKVRRYSSAQMRAAARWDFYEVPIADLRDMLNQAAQTEDDVAGLVEVLREMMRTGNQVDLSDYSARHLMREAAENELARWQS